MFLFDGADLLYPLNPSVYDAWTEFKLFALLDFYWTVPGAINC